MAGVDRRRAWNQRKPVRHRRVEPGIALRRGDYIAAWAGVPARAIGICAGCGAGVGDCAEHEHGLRSGGESVCVQMDPGITEKSKTLFRNRGWDAVHEYEGAGRDFPRELHDERGVWRALSGREAQLDGGSAFHAHLECGNFQPESGDQHDSGATWVGSVPEVRGASKSAAQFPRLTKKGRASHKASRISAIPWFFQREIPVIDRSVAATIQFSRV